MDSRDFGVGDFLWAETAPRLRVYTGEVICSELVVVDGDTLKWDDKRLRLYGIDATESYGS
ncbi:MAG: hypothetical protein GXO16_06455, partial [Epsilonproteobacteria bacterium]|nr:hypothetical protein [Campylobacterota bacterium]